MTDKPSTHPPKKIFLTSIDSMSILSICASFSGSTARALSSLFRNQLSAPVSACGIAR